MKKMFSKIFSKVSFGLFSAAFASALFGCASTKLALGTLSPMAVLNVEGSSVIWEEADDFDYDAQEDEGGGILATSVNKLLNSKNPELQTAADRMNYAEESLRHALEEKCGVQVLEKEKLTESNVYQYEILNLFGILSTNTTADGYRGGIVKLPAKKAQLMMSEIGAESLISAQFEITKKVANKNIYPLVTMKVKIQNRRGKLVVDKEYSAQSAGGVKTYGAYNKYNKNDFVALINPLIDDVINRFASEYSYETSADLENSDASGSSENSADENANFASQKLGKPKSKSDSAENAAQNLTAEEAALKKARETAKNLLSTGLTAQQIADATGLSLEEVESLKK
ncbi:MAG: hypothetical protein SOT81_03310 [Treponema sp.]|nr:hypothetical protein [Treponema sp.]